MGDVLPIDNANSLGGKLREARRLAGLSTRAVVEALAVRYKVSHATISNFERGVGTPSVELLVLLATLYDRPINWFLERSVSLAGVQYRSLSSKVKKIDLQRYEAEGARWLAAYVKIEDFLDRPLTSTRPVLYEGVYKGIPGVEAAKRVRKVLGLDDDDPVLSVTGLLTECGVRSIELETTVSLDGFAAMFGQSPVVVLNPSIASDRARMNAAHEWGHILFGDCVTDAAPSKVAEKRAFEFASHLLLPDSELRDAFVGHSMVKLVRYKERFGLSLAAMIMRAHQAGFISEAQKTGLFIEFGKRGWRTREPGHVRPDRSNRFEELVAEAVESGRLTWKSAAVLLGVREEELLRRREVALGVPEEEDGATNSTIPIR